MQKILHARKCAKCVFVGDVGVAQKSPILTFLYKLTTRSHTVASHPACIQAPSVKVVVDGKEVGDGVEVWHTALQARRTMTCCDRSATTTKSTCSSCASRQYRPRHSPACKRNGSLSFVRLTTRQTRVAVCLARHPDRSPGRPSHCNARTTYRPCLMTPFARF